MLLQYKAFREESSEDLKIFFDINMGSTDKVASVWETSKAYLIAHSTKIKRENLGKEKKLEKEMHKLEKDLSRQFSNDKYQIISKMKLQLHDIYKKES